MLKVPIKKQFSKKGRRLLIQVDKKENLNVCNANSIDCLQTYKMLSMKYTEFENDFTQMLDR